MNDQQLQHRHLLVDMFTNTMFSKVKSKCGNTCAQVFSTTKGWTHVYPMNKKSEAHEALLVLHQREGVPNIMVRDSSKEQLLGMFCHKCRQAGSHVKQTEPYTPWSNAMEGAIHEVNQGDGWEMVCSCAQKGLWDVCLEREALVQSCTAHNIY
jgi:hypothetical protein